MSGHSHAKTVMRTKQAEDAKRSQVFSRLAKELTVVAKEGGPDPAANPRLRTVMEKAKEANMPSENVERAIKKATGEGAGNLEEMLLEAYGPGGVALLISAITDNKNRTLGEIKQILQRNQGKMVEGGGVRWLFERKGADWVAKYPTSVSETGQKSLEQLFEALDEQDDVQDIYSSL